jgi:hypothetical protein
LQKLFHDGKTILRFRTAFRVRFTVAISAADFGVNVIDGKGGTWYVEALCDESNDRSLSAERKIFQATYNEGVWSLANVLQHEYKCRSNHGHEGFSAVKCR